MQGRRIIVAAVSLMALATGARAQDWRTYYTVTHPTEFKINWGAFYQKAERWTADVRQRLPHTLDIAYGDDQKQKLDVYQPVSKPSGAPVFLFLHGGGFREGDRAQYGYVAAPLAQHGIVTLVASYRLTPRSAYPAQPDDVRAALAWAYRHVKEYGGDPDRIYVGGHSAGAILSAFVSMKTDWLEARSLPKNLIKGCVPISGPYDLTKSGAVTEYLPNAAERADASPMFHIDAPPPHTIVAVGSVEPYVDESKAFVERARARGADVELLVLEGLPHDETVAALANDESPLVQAMVRMMTQPAGRRGGGTPGSVDDVEGLWRYVGIGRADRTLAPIDGLFLFHQGRFVQQSINAGDPWDRQLAQAHAGTYRIAGGAIELEAEVGLIIDPTAPEPVQSRRDSRHTVTPSRDGDRLTLTFGTRTIQTFVRVGPGDGRIVALDRGALALVDARFILVAEDGAGGRAAAGSGSVSRDGAPLSLAADRWFTVRGGRHHYERNVEVAAVLGGRSLDLGDRLVFGVTPPALVVRDVTLIDGTGAPAQPGVDVLVRGERIAAVGRAIAAPPGADEIDGRGRFLVPGLIDTHVHLDAPMVFQITADERAQILEHTPLAFLYNGVTTVFNLSSDADWIWKLRDEERAGRLLSPRIYAAGRSFTPEGGWGSRHGGALNTADDARAQARDFIAHRTDGFKVIIEDGLSGSGTYRVMPDDMLRAIADEARRGRVPIYVHAINLSEWRLALSLGPRGIMHGLEDPLPDGDPLPSQIAASGIFVVPTISLFEAFTSFDGHPERFDDPILKASVPSFLLTKMRRNDYMKTEKARFQDVARMDVYPWARRALPVFKANTAKLSKAGVRLAVGTDAGGPVGYNFQGYNTPRELELLVESGLPPLDALVAATRNGAALIGVDRELGTIEPGKRADLLLLAADPLADIGNIRRIETVVLKGVAYPRERFAYHPAPPATQVR